MGIDVIGELKGQLFDIVGEGVYKDLIGVYIAFLVALRPMTGRATYAMLFPAGIPGVVIPPLNGIAQAIYDAEVAAALPSHDALWDFQCPQEAKACPELRRRLIDEVLLLVRHQRGW